LSLWRCVTVKLFKKLVQADTDMTISTVTCRQWLQSWQDYFGSQLLTLTDTGRTDVIGCWRFTDALHGF
jgi:hypothetical protein